MAFMKLRLYSVDLTDKSIAKREAERRELKAQRLRTLGSSGTMIGGRATDGQLKGPEAV